MLILTGAYYQHDINRSPVSGQLPKKQKKGHLVALFSWKLSTPTQITRKWCLIINNHTLQTKNNLQTKHGTFGRCIGYCKRGLPSAMLVYWSVHDMIDMTWMIMIIVLSQVFHLIHLIIAWWTLGFSVAAMWHHLVSKTEARITPLVTYKRYGICLGNATKGCPEHVDMLWCKGGNSTPWFNKNTSLSPGGPQKPTINPYLIYIHWYTIYPKNHLKTREKPYLIYNSHQLTNQSLKKKYMEPFSLNQGTETWTKVGNFPKCAVAIWRQRYKGEVQQTWGEEEGCWILWLGIFVRPHFLGNSPAFFLGIRLVFQGPDFGIRGFAYERQILRNWIVFGEELEL